MINDWMINFQRFTQMMGKKIYNNIPQKNFSWREMSNGELMSLMIRYTEREDWESVANVCFMLWENKRNKIEEQSMNRYP